MKKIRIILFLLLVLGLTLVTTSCTDMNSLMNMFGMGTHVCQDANGDTLCDTCQAYVAPKACTSHVDNDNDGTCDNAGCTATVLMIMEDVEFEDVTKVYTGKAHKISVKGAPEGAKIEYSSKNVQVNAGEYEITAIVTAKGYEDLELTATLTIESKKISIEWVNVGPFPSNGKEPVLEYNIIGAVKDESVEIDFDFGSCDFTEEGTFEIVAKSRNKNYVVDTKGGANKTDLIMGSNSHKVEFVTGIEGKEIEPENVVDGDLLDRPASMLNVGYNFVGWYNGDTEWNFDDPITSSLTLTAKWEAIPYNITYYLSGGTNGADNPTTYTVESGIVLSSPTKADAIFLGWYEDAAYQIPLDNTAPGTRTKDIMLYAKWTDRAQYDGIITGDNLVFAEQLSAGQYRYTLTADVNSFSEDGAIYVGKGMECSDGSYLKISDQKIEIYTNRETTEVEQLVTLLKIRDFIVVDITAKNGKADITVRTADGEYTAYNVFFAGNNGEIFASAENAEIENAEFAWANNSYDEHVWILADENTTCEEDTSWAYYLYNSKIIEAHLFSAMGTDSTDVLSAFEDALLYATPKYAIWSFDSESGSEYDANLAAFLSKCEEKGITPILTTQLTAVNSANAEKNAAVIASGVKYVDFASAEALEGVYSGGYTALGAETLYAKLVTDFPEIITPVSPLKYAELEVMNQENSKLIIGNVKLKDRKVTVFTAEIDGTLDGEEKIIVGHGYQSTYSSWIEINATQVISYRQGAKADSNPSSSAKSHELTIKNYITVILVQDSKVAGNIVTVLTDGGSYSRSWSGSACNGNIAVDIEGGLSLNNAEGYFACKDYSSPIWILGASYFSLGDPARWPYYMYADGLTEDIFMTGRGGMNTTGGLVEFKDALQHGTPKYAIWGLGMNDGGDSLVDGSWNIKQVTYDNHIEFLEICKQNNIEAIFISSVNCTDNYHSGKIDYVFNRLGRFADYDYRVISLPHAVNGYEPGSEWYDGMLSSDGIHPTKLGARNFYLETLCIFPELLMGDGSVVNSTSSATLSAGSTLTVTGTPEYIDSGNMAFSMSADFDGGLDGAIYVGNGKGVEGGTWAKITDRKVEVYRTVAGEDVLITEADNEIILEELIMLRIIVRNNRATIAFVSSDDTDRERTALFSVETDWSYAGNVFVSADTATLTDVRLNFVTK